MGVSEHNSVHLFPPTFEPWAGEPSDRQVAVLMSGGVDSSVTALLLKQAGWQVLGITMKIPVADQCRHPRACCGADAALVCGRLGLAHYFLDVADAFEAAVRGPFEQAYLAGETPSPCVDCNTRLKFGVVWDYLERTFGLRHLATGHYARVVHCAGRPALARAGDRQRDQSYFLYGVPVGRLPHLLLPMGDRDKAAVRALARDAGLDVSEKPDSMELCFAGEGDYRQALAQRRGAPPGPILNRAGEAIGQHEGIINYTLGQRKGVRVTAGEPLYVTRVNPQDNSLTVGTRAEASRSRVVAGPVNVLMPERWRPGERLRGKIRSHGEPAPCRVADASEAAAIVEFETPQFAPAAGQHLVLYDDDDHLVGGGTIRDDSEPTVTS